MVKNLKRFSPTTPQLRKTATIIGKKNVSLLEHLKKNLRKFFFPVWFNMWTLASWLRSQGRKKKSENCIFLLDCDLNWKKKKLNETIKAMTGTNYHCCLTSDKQTNTANIKCVLHGLDWAPFILSPAGTWFVAANTHAVHQISNRCLVTSKPVKTNLMVQSRNLPKGGKDQKMIRWETNHKVLSFRNR